MRKYFMELFAIGLVDSEGKISRERISNDAFVTAEKTLEEMQQMKMEGLFMEACLDAMVYLFDTKSTWIFMRAMSDFFCGKELSKVTIHLENLEALLDEEEFEEYLTEYLGYLTVKVADYIRMKIIDRNWSVLSGTGGKENGEDGV